MKKYSKFTLIELLVITSQLCRDFCKRTFFRFQNTPLFLKEKWSARGKENFFSREKKFACHLASHPFTLIELLVVIAIIAILAGMLLPALNSARERGRASKCISNMKNFSLMFFMYADEYGGFFPDRVHIGKVSQDGSGGGTMDAYYWQNLLIQMYQGVRTARRSRLTYCPSEKIPEGNWVGTFYGANNNIISGYEKNKTEAQNWMRRDPGKVGSFPKPAKTALLVENYGHGDYYLNVTYDPSAENTSSARAANFRHNKKCNVAFVDGHVAATEKKRVPCIESYPSAAFYQLQNTFFNLGEKKSGGGTINKDL